MMLADQYTSLTATTSTTRGWSQELALEFGKLGLQLSC